MNYLALDGAAATSVETATGENETIPGIDVIASKPITMPALREALRKAIDFFVEEHKAMEKIVETEG